MAAATNWPTYGSYKQSGVEWIGDVPREWGVRPLKYGVRLHNGRDHKEVLVEEGYPVYGSGGKFASASDYLYDGDAILLGRKGTIDRPLHVSGKFWTVDTMFFAVCNQTLLTKFAYYCCTTIPFSYFSTSTALPSMTQDDLKNCPLVLPPLSKQTAIAAFLDEKCAKVDEAVRIKEEQIALLRERRQILIQEAVTRGLNPDAPMKESGIDWIGQIPEHWEQLANKHIFRLKKTLVGKQSSEYELLSLTLRGIIKRDMENPEGKFPAEFDTYQEVSPGDFVFCHFDVEETPRTVGLSDFFGMITGAYTVYSVASGIDPRFLLHFYVCADTDKKMRSLYKGLRNTIPKEAFGAFKTPLPPLNEQRAIVAFIDEASLKIENAIFIKQRQIAKLKEYKTALINAAVTGKIKVA